MHNQRLKITGVGIENSGGPVQMVAILCSVNSGRDIVRMHQIWLCITHSLLLCGRHNRCSPQPHNAVTLDRTCQTCCDSSASMPMHMHSMQLSVIEYDLKTAALQDELTEVTKLLISGALVLQCDVAAARMMAEPRHKFSTSCECCLT